MNLKAQGSASGDATARYGLWAKNNQGHVRFQDCEFTGHAGFEGVMSVRDNADLALTYCSAIGGNPAGAGGIGGSGIQAYGSAGNAALTLFSSQAIGKNGAPASGNCGSTGGSGGHGLRATYPLFLFLSNSTFQGGNGGVSGPPSSYFDCAYAGDGGSVIFMDPFFGPLTAHLFGVASLGGQGGFIGSGFPCGTCAYQGSNGAGYTGSTFITESGSPRLMYSPNLAREGTMAMLSFEGGQPGDQVRLLIARSSGYQFQPSRQGVLLLGGALCSVELGVLNSYGFLDVPFPVFQMEPGEESMTLHLQALFPDAQGDTTLSSASSCVVLDQSF